MEKVFQVIVAVVIVVATVGWWAFLMLLVTDTAHVLWAKKGHDCPLGTRRVTYHVVEIVQHTCAKDPRVLW